jgi:hypothetical protein
LVLISILIHVASLPINHLLGVLFLNMVCCGGKIVMVEAKEKITAPQRYVLA